MEINNPCGVCRADIGKYMCNVCNSKVCAQCYDKKKGVCIICRDGLVV
ncbi:MAG: orotate phosphoribosyltransferase [Nanoarchaeota archaeon]|nr:orotate phosphoribosyltransferase [Nanoarchaeota archaeon]